MKFAIIPPGEFMMGCDLNSTITLKIPPGQFREGFARSITESTPRHLVRITRPFYMQMHEVTNGQYQKLIGKLPDFNDPEKPDMALMRGIAPQEATAFCDELSRKEGKTPAHRMVEGRPSRILDANGYRLPTEAEWEYSCRAGTTTIWFLGEDASIAGNLDLLRDYQSMHRGAAVKANPFSLFDQYGGSSEWCFDRFEPYGAKTVIDPFVDPGNSGSIIRGGNEFSGGRSDPGVVSSIARVPENVNQTNYYAGLGRVVLPIEINSARVTPQSTVSAASSGKLFMHDPAFPSASSTLRLGVWKSAGTRSRLVSAARTGASALRLIRPTPVS